MARHWRCERCGTFHGATSRFSDEPEECRECGYTEFETLGGGTVIDAGGGEESTLGRMLNLDAFTWMAMGMAIYNILFGMLGGFGGERMLLYSAGVSFVALLLASYLLSNRTLASWGLAVAVFVGVVAWGLFIVVPALFPDPETMPIPIYGEDGVFFMYGALYILLGLVGLAMLFGGRDEIRRTEEPAEEVPS